MKDARAKPLSTTEPKGDGKDEGVSPEEVIQQTFALPPPPTQWCDGLDGLKVDGVTSCLD
jgi:hypothetical protein